MLVSPLSGRYQKMERSTLYFFEIRSLTDELTKSMLEDHHTSGLFLSLLSSGGAMSLCLIFLYVVPGDLTQVFTVLKQLFYSGVTSPEPWPHAVLHGQFAVLGFAQPHCFFPGFSSLTTLVNHPEKPRRVENFPFPQSKETFTAPLLTVPEMVRSKEVEGHRKGSCERELKPGH